MPGEPAERGFFGHYFLGSSFSAALLPFVLVLVETVVWNVLFDTAMAAWMTSLHPVAQYLWLPLIPLVVGSGIAMYSHQQAIYRFRMDRVAELFSILRPTGNGQKLAELFFNSLCDKPTTTFMEMINSMPMKNQIQIEQLYWRCKFNESTSRPVLLITTLLVCAWIFALSIPFLFWGYYNRYGYFALLITQYPVLAFAHGATKHVDAFGKYNDSYFIPNDLRYEARALTQNPYPNVKKQEESE